MYFRRPQAKTDKDGQNLGSIRNSRHGSDYVENETAPFNAALLCFSIP
jgi:hypothetical protein